jgi:hypothetical protein
MSVDDRTLWLKWQRKMEYQYSSSNGERRERLFQR